MFMEMMKKSANFYKESMAFGELGEMNAQDSGYSRSNCTKLHSCIS